MASYYRGVLVGPAKGGGSGWRPDHSDRSIPSVASSQLPGKHNEPPAPTTAHCNLESEAVSTS